MITIIQASYRCPSDHATIISLTGDIGKNMQYPIQSSLCSVTINVWFLQAVIVISPLGTCPLKCRIHVPRFFFRNLRFLGIPKKRGISLESAAISLESAAISPESAVTESAKDLRFSQLLLLHGSYSNRHEITPYYYNL